MGQSLAKNLIHLIYSTKDRRPLLDEAIRDDVHRYAAGIFREQESPALILGSVPDHVHVLFNLSKNKALATVVREVKAGSSRWIKTQGAAYAEFEWQNGYGAFSVSQSNADEVRQYIAHQSEHHQKTSFQDELRAFFRRHQVEFKEEYVWD